MTNACTPAEAQGDVAVAVAVEPVAWLVHRKNGTPIAWFHNEPEARSFWGWELRKDRSVTMTPLVPAASIASLSERLEREKLLWKSWHDQQKDRADGFAKECDELRAKLAEAREVVTACERKIVGMYMAACPHGSYDGGNRFADTDPDAIRARAFRDATSEGDAG